MSIIQDIPQKIHLKPNKYFVWVDITFLLLLVVYILSGINLVPFHGDESTYILMSEDYDKLVKQGDFGRVLFNPEGNSKQYIRLTTGSILSFSIGFARDITDNEEPLSKWLWGSSWEENVKQGNMPTPQVLHLARTCSALMGGLSVVLFFLTALQLFSSRLAAWAATLVLTTHGDFLINIRRAMQEGPKFLFLILTLYIASHMLKDFQSVKTRRYLYVLLGVASGLTLAAKQDTVPMLVAIYIALAIIPIWKKETVETILVNIFYLGTATLLALASFLAFMPVFWSWWETVFVLIGFVIILFQLPVWKIDRMSKPLALAGFVLVIGMTVVSPILWERFPIPIISMIETRKATISNQVALLHINNFNTVEDRMKFLLKTTFTSNVMYSENSNFDIPDEQINAYNDLLTSGRKGGVLADGFVAVLALIGGWSLIRQFNAESLLIYSLLIITGVLLFAMIPLPWQRYFVIMQIPYSLIAGVGASRVWGWRNFFNKTPVS